MVDVRVRQNDGINRPWINGRNVPVPEAQLFQPLKQSAINEDLLSCGFKKELRSRDSFRCTKEGQMHPLRILPVRRFIPTWSTFNNARYDYRPMDSSNANNIATELQRRAEQKFGRERAQKLESDLKQLAAELAALEAYNLGFDDEP